MKIQVTLADAAMLAVITAVIIFLSIQVYTGGGEASQVRIDAAGLQWVYPLDTELKVIIPGPIGDTEVVIEDGQVHVHDSACRNKVCVTSGIIQRVGQWIICLPNDVFIRIEGREQGEREVDDVAF